MGVCSLAFISMTIIGNALNRVRQGASVISNKVRNAGVAAGVALLGTGSAHAADPTTLAELHTELQGKFSAVETIVIAGFVLGAGIIVGMIILHWVNRGSRAKVK